MNTVAVEAEVKDEAVPDIVEELDDSLSDILPEDKFKIAVNVYVPGSESSIVVFRLQKTLVSSRYVVSIEETAEGIRKETCTCSTFKNFQQCTHVKRMFETKLINSGSGVLNTFPVDKTSLPSNMIGVEYKGTAGEVVALIDSDVGDMSLNQFVGALNKEHTPSAGRMSINRLLAELEFCSQKNIPINQVETVEVGLKVVGRGPGSPPKPKTPDPVKLKKKPVSPNWKRIPLPADFIVDKDVWETILLAAMSGRRVLLKGPSGCGKSELAYEVAKALGVPITAFNMGAMSEPRSSLIGNTHFNREKGTWFQESRFVRAVQAESGIVLLDEITRAVPSAFNILLPLLDRQGYLALDESENAPVIKRGERISFMATANIGMEYTGVAEMDRALDDRFDAVIDLDFPKMDQEFKLIKSRFSILDMTAKQLCAIAETQRLQAKTDNNFTTLISTRMLLAVAEFISNGMRAETALKFGLLNHFSAEGGAESDRAKVLMIVQKNGSMPAGSSPTGRVF